MRRSRSSTSARHARERQHPQPFAHRVRCRVRRERELRAELDAISRRSSPNRTTSSFATRCCSGRSRPIARSTRRRCRRARRPVWPPHFGPVNARLIDSARPCRRALLGPNLRRNLALGMFGGLFLGVALVLIRERTDGSIRQPGAMPQYTCLRELGVIPSAKAEAQFSVGRTGVSGDLSAAAPFAPQRSRE